MNGESGLGRPLYSMTSLLRVTNQAAEKQAWAGLRLLLSDFACNVQDSQVRCVNSSVWEETQFPKNNC